MLLFECSRCTVAWKHRGLQGKLLIVSYSTSEVNQLVPRVWNLSPYLCLICINCRHILATVSEHWKSAANTRFLPFTRLLSVRNMTLYTNTSRVSLSERNLLEIWWRNDLNRNAAAAAVSTEIFGKKSNLCRIGALARDLFVFFLSFFFFL